MSRALVVVGVVGVLLAVRRVRTIGADALPPIGRRRPPRVEPTPEATPRLGATGAAPEPLWPLGGKGRWERWGSPDWQHVGGGKVEMDPDWEAEHLETREVPELGRTLTMHREFFGPFRAWVKDALAEGLITKRTRIDANRLARLSRRHGVYGEWPSSHAYGTAFDLDPEAYPESSTANAVIRRLAELAARHGMGWGGLLPDPDPMHFELVVQERAA